MTTLAQYERARAALAEATRIDQVLPLLEEVEHVKLYARQIGDRELLADAHEFQLKAERRLGIVIAAAKEAGHFRQGKRKESSGEELSRATLEEVGVDKKLSARSQKAASISERAYKAMLENRRAQIIAGKAIPANIGEINGSRSIMGSRQEPDDSLDYFPTPPWATRALFERVFPAIGEVVWSSIWEPACGEGHIAEVAREYCPRVRATDVFDYGYGEVQDFLQWDLKPRDERWIITNPPFGDAALNFVERAIAMAHNGVAMFFRSQWAVEGIERYERVFSVNPPTLCAFFVERVNLCKGRWEPDGSTATAYCWLIWRKGDNPRAPFWIPPGCRDALTKPDDRERFTAHPVIKRVTQADDGTPCDADGVLIEEPRANADAEAPPMNSPNDGEGGVESVSRLADRRRSASTLSEKDDAQTSASGVTAGETAPSSEDLEIPAFLKRGDEECSLGRDGEVRR